MFNELKNGHAPWDKWPAGNLNQGQTPKFAKKKG